MRHDESVYLRHILDSIARIELYLQGVDETAFQQHDMAQDAVIRQLEIIGEAVKRLSPELCDQHPQIPWSDIARMRDKLIHGYFGVDIDKVWLTTQDDLPVFKAQVNEMLKQIVTPSSDEQSPGADS
jgi:uncharacterized protein with HEPN domain